MSLIGEKPTAKYIVNGMTVDVDDFVESAVIDLESATKSFHYLWDVYFSGIEEPKNWKYQYREISAYITAYKMLMDRITDDLLSAFGMASDYTAARFAILGSTAKLTSST